jgi:molecular chaperone HscB
MQLEELRAQKKLGADDPALLEEIGKQKVELEQKHEALLIELQGHWNAWDELIETAQGSAEITQPERKHELNLMVDVLNRRNYIRNLVRDVGEALGE